MGLRRLGVASLLLGSNPQSFWRGGSGATKGNTGGWEFSQTCLQGEAWAEEFWWDEGKVSRKQRLQLWTVGEGDCSLSLGRALLGDEAGKWDGVV